MDGVQLIAAEIDRLKRKAVARGQGVRNPASAGGVGPAHPPVRG
jgi:hypothetical protein